MKNLLKNLKVKVIPVIASLILFASVPALYAWTAPTQTPPAGNVAAPVNVGSISQNKSGVLGLGGLAVFGKSLMTELSGYTLPVSKPSMLLGVNGAIGAKEYCDQNGQNCVTTLGGGSGGGSSGVNGWENVPLNDQAPFDPTCEYRFKMNTDETYPYFGSDSFFHATAVNSKSIVYVSNGPTSNIYSASKTIYRLNDSPIYTVTKMEKRCGGVGGSSSSGGQLLPGWPNAIRCGNGEYQSYLFIASKGMYGPGTISYYAGNSGNGSNLGITFKYSDGSFMQIHERTTAGEKFAAAMDTCKKNIKDIPGI